MYLPVYPACSNLSTRPDRFRASAFPAEGAGSAPAADNRPPSRRPGRASALNAGQPAR
ncbi:MAG: hypothetical protein H6631_03660 [Anaerolineaceae bacterium]|nr:hypothetical protein [Anaerolineaceae bacterium]